MNHTAAGRFNRFASLAVLPVMLLAILAFSRQAQRGAVPPPPAEGTLVVASLRSDLLELRSLSDGTSRTLALPAAPHELVEAGGRLYATLPRAGLLAEIDYHAPGLLRLVQLQGQPHGIAFDPGQGVLYITLDTADSVVAYDAASLSEIGRWPTGAAPHVVALADGVPHVAAARDDRLEAVRPSGGVAVPVGRLPEAVAALPALVAAASYVDGTLHLVRPLSLEPIADIPLGGGPVRILPLDARTLAVALQEAGQVAIVDVERRAVLRRLEVPARPDGLCRSPSGAYLAVVSNAESRITVFETASWRVAARYSVAEGPGACLWLPG